MGVTSFLWGVYYWLFPEQLERKRELERLAEIARKRRERADLLLRFDELVKQRNDLREWLKESSENTAYFADLIADLLNGGLEYRKTGKSAAYLIRDFDASTVPDFEEVRQKGLEYEALVLRIYVVRKKLRLENLESGLEVRRWDGIE